MPAFDVEQLPEPVRARVLASRAAEPLASVIAQARQAHPRLLTDPARFAAHVVSRVPSDVDLVAHLAAVRADDLLIAYACASGHRDAIACFEQRCFDEIAFAHMRVRPDVSVDEIAQMLRSVLFVGSPAQPPKVLQYSGSGDLRSWFRVVAMRHMLNLATRAPKERGLDEAMLDLLPGQTADPEIELARRLYGDALRDALIEAIALLEPRERTLLRLAICDGLTVDAVGTVYGVHRATAARWIAAARNRLQAHTAEGVRARLGVREDSVASLLRMLASQVELSLRGHLLSNADAATE